MQVQERWNIGSLTLPNRILLAPVKTGFGTPDGQITDKTLAYFARRAEGGAGALITEPLAVDRRGREHPRQLGIEVVHENGLKRLAETIHSHGSMAIAHLNHAGRAANPKASGAPPEAPSSIICPSTGATAEEMSTARIAELLDAFAQAAGRAKGSGFNAVEVQFGLGYLVSQFWSPRTNLRTDEYGGSEENRRRFAVELLGAIRKQVGPEYPIIARISASEQVEGGLTIEDAVEMTRFLEQHEVDAIHVVTGSACETPPWYYQHMALPPEKNEMMAAKIKQNTSLPVIVAGRMGDPDKIKKVLNEGMVDAVALGRALVADPDLPKKMFDGQPETIARCGHCLQGCLLKVKTGVGLGCIINPEVGEESLEVKAVEHPKRVAIIGGGPAGLQAALTAQKRGHNIEIFERNDHLGGQFEVSFLVPGKKSMEKPYRYLVEAVERNGIPVHFGVEMDADTILQNKPDAVIVATGSKPAMIAIEGLKDVCSGTDILTGNVEAGNNVLIIGGGLVGVETAEFLLNQGKSPVIVEMLDDIARDMEPVSRKLALKKLNESQTPVHISTKITRFDGNTASGEKDGKEIMLGSFDTVVMAVGAVKVDTISEQLTAEGVETHIIGDAAQPRQIYDAVKEGWRVAMEL